jgi:signal transduction histidine kinase
MQKPRAQDMAESLGDKLASRSPDVADEYLQDHLALAGADRRGRDDFLASIAHDLRTPLNAIGGYAELIEMGIGGAVSSQQQEYLDRIRTAQQDLLSLINDLLSYSRIETR